MKMSPLSSYFYLFLYFILISWFFFLPLQKPTQILSIVFNLIKINEQIVIVYLAGLDWNEWGLDL